MIQALKQASGNWQFPHPVTVSVFFFIGLRIDHHRYICSQFNISIRAILVVVGFCFVFSGLSHLCFSSKTLSCKLQLKNPNPVTPILYCFQEGKALSCSECSCDLRIVANATKTGKQLFYLLIKLDQISCIMGKLMVFLKGKQKGECSLYLYLVALLIGVEFQLSRIHFKISRQVPIQNPNQIVVCFNQIVYVLLAI